MRVPSYLMATCLLGLMLSPAVPANADVPETWDGLVQVKAKRLEAVYVMPGADFSGYRKVMIDPAEVAFNKNWSKEMQRDPARRISDADAQKIASTAQSGFDEVFAQAFGKAGHEVVTAPGPDVLRPASPISTSTPPTSGRPQWRGSTSSRPARRRWCWRSATRSPARCSPGPWTGAKHAGRPRRRFPQALRTRPTSCVSSSNGPASRSRVSRTSWNSARSLET
jgi:hypothetical protein